MSDFAIMTAKPCEAIDQFARRMIVEAYLRNGIVLGEHNQHTLEARPGSTVAAVLRDWNEATRRSYLGIS